MKKVKLLETEHAPIVGEARPKGRVIDISHVLAFRKAAKPEGIDFEISALEASELEDANDILPMTGLSEDFREQVLSVSHRLALKRGTQTAVSLIDDVGSQCPDPYKEGPSPRAVRAEQKAIVRDWFSDFRRQMKDLKLI